MFAHCLAFDFFKLLFQGKEQLNPKNQEYRSPIALGMSYAQTCNPPAKDIEEGNYQDEP